MHRMFLVMTFAVLTVLSFELGMPSWSQTVRAADGTPPGKPPTRPPASKIPKPKTPLTANWYLKALEEKYTILSHSYDEPHKRFIWELQTKQKGPAGRFEAFFQDGDGVSAGRLELTFFPRKAEYDKGVRVQAVAPLPTPEVWGEVAKVTIRPVKVTKPK